MCIRDRQQGLSPQDQQQKQPGEQRGGAQQQCEPPRQQQEAVPQSNGAGGVSHRSGGVGEDAAKLQQRIQAMNLGETRRETGGGDNGDHGVMHGRRMIGGAIEPYHTRPAHVDSKLGRLGTR